MNFTLIHDLLALQAGLLT